MRLLPSGQPVPAAVEQAVAKYLPRMSYEGTEWNPEFWARAVSPLRKGALIGQLPRIIDRSFLAEYLGDRYSQLPKTAEGLTHWLGPDSQDWAVDCFLLARIWGDAPGDPVAERLSVSAIASFGSIDSRRNFVNILRALEEFGLSEAFRLAESFNKRTGVPYLGPAYMTKCWYMAAEAWGAPPPLIADRHVVNFFRFTQLLDFPIAVAWRRPEIEYLSIDEYLRYNGAMYDWARRLSILPVDLEFCVFEAGKNFPIPPEDQKFGGERG